MFLQMLQGFVEPRALDSSPNVLSLGHRCVVDGYIFHWDGYSIHPWLMHPRTLDKFFLEVLDFVPYLRIGPGDAQVNRTVVAGPAQPNIAELVKQAFAKNEDSSVS